MKETETLPTPTADNKPKSWEIPTRWMLHQVLENYDDTELMYIEQSLIENFYMNQKAWDNTCQHCWAIIGLGLDNNTKSFCKAALLSSVDRDHKDKLIITAKHRLIEDDKGALLNLNLAINKKEPDGQKIKLKDIRLWQLEHDRNNLPLGAGHYDEQVPACNKDYMNEKEREQKFTQQSLINEWQVISKQIPVASKKPLSSLKTELEKLEATLQQTQDYGRVGRHLPANQAIKRIHHTLFKDTAAHKSRVAALELKIEMIKGLIKLLNTGVNTGQDYTKLKDFFQPSNTNLKTLYASTSLAGASTEHKAMVTAITKLKEKIDKKELAREKLMGMGIDIDKDVNLLPEPPRI